jgi:lycopene cyclase CruP
VHPNGVRGKGDQPFTARLLIDAWGTFRRWWVRRGARASPMRCVWWWAPVPRAIPHNDRGDLLVSFTPLRHQCQYFWEAFPARDGRTTYSVTYMDADPRRLSLTEFFEEYWTLLPEYQQVNLAELRVQRALFGFFPCYRQSPLRYPWGRTLAVGDSSGSQSPLSFGGFGAMIRHLERLVTGIDEGFGGAIASAPLPWARSSLTSPTYR